MDTVDATFYVQLEPIESQYNRGVVVGAKMARATITRVTPKAGTVNIKLTVRLPKVAFDPLEPSAIVEIPASMIQAASVEVIAQEPTP